MIGLRFLGLRARLLLLFVLAGLGGSFALVPLLPSERLAEAYPRMALVVALAAVVAAIVGRAASLPLEALRRSLLERIEGREVLPPPDNGHDEVRALRDALASYLEARDRRLRPADSDPPKGAGDARTLLALASRLPGPGGARGAVGRFLVGVQEALKLGRVSLLLLDEASGRLQLVAASGLPEDLQAELERTGPRPVRFAAGTGVAGRALDTGRAQVAPRGRRDRLFAKLGGEHDAEIRNLACAPLRRDGRIVGVVNAVNCGRPSGFDPAAVDFLERAATLVEGWLPGLDEVGLPVDGDPLAGVLRFEAWEEALRAEVERVRRRPRGLAVAVIELAFPSGDPAGAERNAALAEVGAALRQGFRGLDAVGREGDRFFVCLPETDAVGALHMLGRIKERVDLGAVVAAGSPPRYAAVAGLATVPETLEDPERLVDAAEDALLAARRAGDYRVVCFGAEAA